MPARKVERNSRQMLAVSVNAAVELRLTGLASCSAAPQELRALWLTEVSLLKRKMQSLETHQR